MSPSIFFLGGGGGGVVKEFIQQCGLIESNYWDNVVMKLILLVVVEGREKGAVTMVNCGINYPCQIQIKTWTGVGK